MLASPAFINVPAGPAIWIQDVAWRAGTGVRAKGVVALMLTRVRALATRKYLLFVGLFIRNKIIDD